MKFVKLNWFKKSILRKNKIFGIFLLLAYMPSQAEIIIRSGATAFTDYAAWIATHPDDKSWMSQLEKLHPSKFEASQITEVLEAAQKDFLTGSLNEAKKNFRRIADQADLSDWRQIEREAITYSMLRYFQLEKSSIGANYLKRAAIYGYDVHFDPSIFPPPIASAWKAEVKKALKKAVKISNLKDFEGFDIMKIDGRSYALRDTDFINILPGEHRVSLLSSHAQYFTQKINSSQLQVMKIEPVALISGTCANPIAAQDLHFAFTALFDEACVRTYTGQNWVARNSSGVEKLELQSALYKDSVAHLNSEAQLSSPPENSHKWLWIGLSALVVGSLVMVYQNNPNLIGSIGGSSNTQETVTPVHSERN